MQIGHDWALGFLRGLELRKPAWDAWIESEEWIFDAYIDVISLITGKALSDIIHGIEAEDAGDAQWDESSGDEDEGALGHSMLDDRMLDDRMLDERMLGESISGSDTADDSISDAHTTRQDHRAIEASGIASALADGDMHVSLDRPDRDARTEDRDAAAEGDDEDTGEEDRLLSYDERLEIVADLPWLLIDLHVHRIEMMTPREPIRREPTPGRNDPCPCGSGKKYKKCHG
jgi:hypothetical protein